MTEKEYKCVISEDVYKRIHDRYKWDWEKHQINSYYADSSGELGKRHIVVRVREKDGRFAVQVKAHKNFGEALQICEETEFPVQCAPESFSAEDGFVFTGVRTGELNKLGSLDTLRSSLMWKDGVELCLDKSEYLDRTDYEIEVEYSGETPDGLLEELSEEGAAFTQKATGKYTRFVTRLNEIIHGK